MARLGRSVRFAAYHPGPDTSGAITRPCSFRVQCWTHMAKRGFGRFIQEDLGPGSRRVRVAGGVRLAGFACSSAIARAGRKPVDRVLMGPTFGGFLLVFAFWIPWTAVAAALRNAWPARGRYAMLYDGSCGVCRRTVDIVQRLDVLGRVDVLDAARDWPSVERRYPMLSQAACLDEMHVLRPDGRSRTRVRRLPRARPGTAGHLGNRADPVCAGRQMDRTSGVQVCRAPACASRLRAVAGSARTGVRRSIADLLSLARLSRRQSSRSRRPLPAFDSA